MVERELTMINLSCENLGLIALVTQITPIRLKDSLKLLHLLQAR